MGASGLLLILSVGVVGVLHTAVPDHWAPIALLARQRGWTRRETARAAVLAGIGHVGTTLVIGLVVWAAGAAFAARFGAWVGTAASVALVGFGGWIAISAWREQRGEHGLGHSHDHDDHHGHGHSHPRSHRHVEGWRGRDDALGDPLYAPMRGVAVLTRHAHAHRHSGVLHTHRHDHTAASAHDWSDGTDAPAHTHKHRTSARTALPLILGSSPMVEGIPAFLAASRYGIGLLLAMAVVFAASTIATYVALSVSSAAASRRVSLGPLERHGEVLSGVFIAAVGVVFWVWPVM